MSNVIDLRPSTTHKTLQTLADKIMGGEIRSVIIIYEYTQEDVKEFEMEVLRLNTESSRYVVGMLMDAISVVQGLHDDTHEENNLE